MTLTVEGSQHDGQACPRLPIAPTASAAMRCAWARCRDRATSARRSASPSPGRGLLPRAEPTGPTIRSGRGATDSCSRIGHYAIALYAALIEAGIVPEDELETYGGDDSRLPMSGMATYTPGMEITGGSLGQGLPIAVGMALGLRQKGNPAFVYNCMSDGELDEGSTWEAAMSASHLELAQPDHARRRQQPAGRRSVDQGAGLRAAGGQVGSVRLARAARQTATTSAGGGRRLRHGAQPERSRGRA